MIKKQRLNSEELIHSNNLIHSWHPAARLKHGWLCAYLDQQPSAEFDTILPKMAAAFDLAYTRFLDLQKAEAQAREQIELGLERVRARAMAMQNSDELKELIGTVFTELTKLDLVLTRCLIMIYDGGEDSSCWWMANSEDPNNPAGFFIKYHEHPPIVAYFKAWRERKIKYTYALQGKIKQDWDDFLFNETELKNLPGFVIEGMRAPDLVYLNASFNNFGNLTLASLEPISNEHFDILLRFAKVFDLTYTRFNDLQKAEAQAREAHIELALERVRSRSMAMHQTSELQDVIHTVHKELMNLDLSIDGGSFVTINEEVGPDLRCWGSGGTANTSEEVVVPHFNLPFVSNLVNGIKKRQGFFTEEFSQEEKKEFFTKLFECKPWSNLSEEDKKQTLSSPGGYTRSVAVSKHTSIFIINHVGRKFTDAENDILKRFAKVFEQTYTRFLDLQKAEAQAREARIQLALERVRARTMAMQHSDELAEASLLLDKQVRALGIPTRGCGFNIYGDNESTEWFSSETGTMPTYKTPREKLFLRYYEEGKKGKPIHIESFAGEACAAHYEYLMTIPIMGDGLKQLKASGGSFPEQQVDHVTYFKYGYLLFITLEPAPEAHDIFIRFAKVFEQTYTRFLDLQQAEAQARESQIQLALERVRARTMAMQHSDELSDTAAILFNQFKNLGYEPGRITIGIMQEEKQLVDLWATDGEAGNLKEFYQLPLNEPHVISKCVKAWKEQRKSLVLNLHGQPLKEYAEFWRSFSTMQDARSKVEHVVLNFAFFSKGYLGFISFEQVPTQTIELLERFAGVFDLTYTRFLDLQKAEAQAKEARIETALERVRSIAMSMMKSEDLKHICEAVYKQLSRLGFNNVRAAQIYIRNDEEEKFINYDYADVSGADVVEVNYNSHANTRRIYDVIRTAGDGLIHNMISKKELQAWKDYLYKTLQQPPEKNLDKADELHYYLYSFGIGAFGISTFARINDDELEILKRFRNVFSLSYQRYMDIALAEAQAKEARIETALERVRSRTLAMQKSDELAETAAVLFKQLILLGIEPNRLYISIMKNNDGDTEFWITDEDGSKVSMAYEDNLNNNPSFKKMYDGWKQQKKSLLIDMKGKELEDYLNYLSSIHVPFKGGLAQKRRWQYIAYFSKGFIGMASPDEQPSETLQLLERFAYVFNLTFTRFNDLQIAEAHAVQAEHDLIEIKEARKKAEETLAELQSTQKQLVQSEKMASLGELTAGIAHEIQNPLNFVNNFSEVSKELIDEMRAALENGNKKEADEIANDIIQNLEKINHHGKRADAIVKGMLQHSRKSSGQKEPTDINALCDEYLRLCYHGLRAKDTGLNANINTDFDTTIQKINIIPQDIGRVILNILTNAFYAVNEKSQRSTVNSQQPLLQEYKPLVSVTTRKITPLQGMGAKVEITVSDNGNGIPQNIIDKIFQPFFTTKPTGEGTGLGLSLVYDIITKEHNGTIKVESKEGEGSEFIILIPIQS